MRSHDTDANGRPIPRGGWFAPDNTAPRRRIERGFHILAVTICVLVALGGLGFATSTYLGRGDTAVIVFTVAGTFAASGFAYFMTQLVGGLITSLAWGSIAHDLGLRETWAALMEIALFCASMAMQLYSLIDAVKYGSLHSAIVLALLVAMTWWPFIRHRIRHGRWPG